MLEERAQDFKEIRAYINRYGKDIQMKRTVLWAKPLRGEQGRVGLGNSSWEGSGDPTSFITLWRELVSCYREA